MRNSGERRVRACGRVRGEREERRFAGDRGRPVVRRTREERRERPRVRAAQRCGRTAWGASAAFPQAPIARP